MRAHSMTPAWRRAVASLIDNGGHTYGSTITHDEMRQALDLPKPSGRLSADEYERWRLELMTQVDAFSEHLLVERAMCLKSVHGVGYLIVEPAKQTEFAVKKGRKKIRNELQRMASRLSFINYNALTIDQRRENADAVARLAFLEQQFSRSRRKAFLFSMESK